MNRLLALLLAPWLPGGWLCARAVDEGGGEDEPDEPDPDAEVEDEPDSEPDDDAEPDEDLEPGPDDEPDPGAAGGRGSRRQNRVQALDNRLKAEKAERERVEQELAQLRGQQPGRQPAPQKTEREIQAEEEAAGISYDKRLYNAAARSEQRRNSEIAELRLEQRDSLDSMRFDSECARNPVAERNKATVEKKYAELRRNGSFAPRRVILALVLGEKVLDAGGKKAPNKKRDAAAARIDRSRGEPPGNRSDAGASSGSRKDTPAAREKRLTDVNI